MGYFETFIQRVVWACFWKVAMKKIDVYGIKNCDTMKKAFAWLDKHRVSYVFHDYKKEGADEAVLKAAMRARGWEDVINRKGMTWRNLPDRVRQGMDERAALAEALKNPSLVKRPLIICGSDVVVGFDEDLYKKEFA